MIRNRLSGFVSVYNAPRHTRSKYPAVQGATVIATVKKGATANRWYSAFGKKSIGFGTASDLTGQFKPAYIRIGSELFHFRAVRNQDAIGEKPCKKVDIRQKKGLLTEATFMVSKKEMDAFAAYYKARYLGLIKKDGQTIQPTYKKAGDSANFRSEGCASACTSAFNPLWLQAFEQNLSGIKAYGAKHGITALKNASRDTIATLRTFSSRTSGIQRGPKALIRTNFPRADLITVFNARDKQDREIMDPMGTLKWSGWHGLSAPVAMFDNGPGQNGKSFKGTRMSLTDFSANLR